MANLAGSEDAMCQLDISFSGRNLKNMDWLSKSDPIVQVYFLRKDANGLPKYDFIGQTERIDDNLNPDWAKSILVDFHFEETQIIVCRVLDVDDDKVTFKDADFIGETKFQLSQLIAAKGQQLVQKLILQEGGTDTNRGTLIISAEEVAAGNALVTLDVRVEDLHSNSKWYNWIWHSPSPQLIIRRSREDGTWLKVFESEVVPSSKNPQFKKFRAKSSKLCNADLDRPLRIEIVDASHGTDHAEVMCHADTSITALQSSDGRPLQLRMPHKDRRDGELSGKLRVMVDVQSLPTFLDYVRGGLELNLHIAIDFTASNGDVNYNTSLHYMDPNYPNQYQRVIQTVGRILEEYDSDKLIPVYAFGCKTPNGQVSHVYPIGPGGNQVQGISGVLEAYQDAMKKLKLSGPTLFAPMLNNLVHEVSTQTKFQAQNYNIMLILTDGSIHDMQPTIDAIVKSSHLPISIIIVGIGEADFGMMDQLDADEGLLRASNGQEQLHDNVQFVPFNKFKGSASVLAREVLKELPDQVVTHFEHKKISPAPPRSAPNTSLARANTGISVGQALQRAPTFEAGDSRIYPSAPPPPPTVPDYVVAQVPAAVVKGTAVYIAGSEGT